MLNHENPIIKKTVDFLKVLRADEKIGRKMQYRERAMRGYNSARKAKRIAEHKVWKLADNEAQKSQKIAVNMLVMGLSPKQIKVDTGLSEQAIVILKNQLFTRD